MVDFTQNGSFKRADALKCPKCALNHHTNLFWCSGTVVGIVREDFKLFGSIFDFCSTSLFLGGFCRAERHQSATLKIVFLSNLLLKALYMSGQLMHKLIRNSIRARFLKFRLCDFSSIHKYYIYKLFSRKYQKKLKSNCSRLKKPVLTHV